MFIKSYIYIYMMLYSPYIITATSIHHTSANVTSHLTSNISTTTKTIDPLHQSNANTPRNIPKPMDLKLSSNHIPTLILSS